MDSGLKETLEPLARQLCEERGWVLGRFLGAGATAAVFEIVVGTDTLALKLFSPTFLVGRRGEQVRLRLKLVLEQLKDHDCPHLIEIIEGGDYKFTSFVLMERAPGRCLGDILKQIPAESIREIIKQIATAARFLEMRNLCHRDIKTDNVVVSDDFSKATLLDLGVVRWLDEEGTSGTDEDGQLPFIATARYSSPEYMFRLVHAGPDLWRGLTFYQLGGVLYDMLRGEKLFEEVVSKSAENRYLIAYAVAARSPLLENDGTLPIDLVILAKRCLDKDISRRLAMVTWDDFLGASRKRNNEILLGLRGGTERSPGSVRDKVFQLAGNLERALDAKLTAASIHCVHKMLPVASNHYELRLTWSPPIDNFLDDEEITVRMSFCEQGRVPNHRVCRIDARR